MAAKSQPIVITLKKRLGAVRQSEQAEDAGGGSGGCGGGGGGKTCTESLDSPASQARSRSGSLSKRRSLSPLSPLRAPTIAPSAVLNVTELEEIFARFHGKLDTWLKSESGKLERADSRGRAARTTLAQCANQVCEFLREHYPRVFADLGPNATGGEAFTVRALPQFLEAVDEDRRALQEIAGLLNSFAERRFPKNEELAALKTESSPLPLMRAILRLLGTRKPSPRRSRAAANAGSTGTTAQRKTRAVSRSRCRSRSRGRSRSSQSGR